jgi:hypothetical protein
VSTLEDAADLGGHVRGEEHRSARDVDEDRGPVALAAEEIRGGQEVTDAV